VCLAESLSPNGSGVTHGGGDGVKVAAVVAVGDPLKGAGGEAGSGGEAHRVRSFDLKEFYRQPPTESAGGVRLSECHQITGLP